MYRGKRPIYYPAQGKIIVTLYPLLHGGIFGASVPYTVVRWPTRFVLIPGEPWRYVYWSARASISIRNTRIEIRTRVLHDAKYKGISY